MCIPQTRGGGCAQPRRPVSCGARAPPAARPARAQVRHAGRDLQPLAGGAGVRGRLEHDELAWPQRRRDAPPARLHKLRGGVRVRQKLTTRDAQTL